MYHLEIIRYLLEHRKTLCLDIVLSTPPNYNSLNEEEYAILSTRWYEAFLHYFVELSNTNITSDQMDDLLFFVKEQRNGVTISNNDMEEERVMVRRRRTDDDPRLPILRQPIDWGRTFLLNLIFQSTFYLVVSVCIRQNSSKDIHPSTNLIVKHQVSRKVFASQHEIHILERRNQSSTHPPCSYPIMYFGIDDLEDAFEGFMVEKEQVMCVELLLMKKTDVHEVTKPGEYLNSTNSDDHVMLFQGAVSHEALHNACQIKRHKNLLYGNQNGIQSVNTILMRGPHGKGLSQVIIDRVDRTGIMNAVRSRVLGRNSTTSNSTLKCRLVFVSLSWQDIIQDMLADVKT